MIIYVKLSSILKENYKLDNEGNAEYATFLF